MLANVSNVPSAESLGVPRPRLLAGFVLAGALALPAGLAHAGWTAAIQPDPISRQARCLLRSDPVLTPAGHDDTTPVTLVFNGSSLVAITQSDLDGSFADLQLTVDKNPPIRSANIVRDMLLVFDQNLPDLVRQLQEGHQATVYLRFWPTWPVTQTFPVTFSLAGFRKAHDAMNQSCQAPAGTNPVPR